jgi:acyl carrier protein
VLKRAPALEPRLGALADRTSEEIVPYDLPEPGARAAPGAGIFGRHVETGMTPEEGLRAFELALARELWPRVVVATRDLDAMAADLAELPGQGAGAETADRTVHPRPNVATPYEAPADEVERRLAALWCGLLGISDVGRHDRFFELGGDSLLGLQLVARLRSELGVAVSPGDVFEAPTVAGQAAVVRGAAPAS